MNFKRHISFIHANGFPPKAYHTLLTNLALKISIKSFLLRPLDNTKNKQIDEIQNWIPFHKDKNQRSDKHNQGICCCWHHIHYIIKKICGNKYS